MKEKDHKVLNAVKSIKWLLFWISLTLIFNLGVLFFLGKESAIDFLGSYLMEFSLSIDNVFVFLLIFTSFGIPEPAQHRVLGWGIMGAIVLRFLFIFFGITLVSKFQWILYIFGVLLVFSGAKIFRSNGEEAKDPHDSKIIKAVRKVIPMTLNFQDDRFTVKENGKRLATPLLAVLILVEISDIMFAIDSVPAVLSITTNLFIVYTSNVFAILGLRQLFFVVEHMQEKFKYVKYGVAIILIFTGIKLFAGIIDIHISTAISISVILTLLVGSVITSIILSKKGRKNIKRRN